MKIYEKIVLITGGAGDLGLCLAREFLSRGAQVILADVNNMSMQVRTLVEEGFPSQAITTVHCNLMNGNNREDLFKRFGESVDILVNNAGVQFPGNFTAECDANIDTTFAVNVMAPMHIAQLFMGNLEKRGGTIVNITSASAIDPARKLAVYSASKAALGAWSTALDKEQRAAGRGLHILTVYPYFMIGKLFSKASTRFPRLLPIQTPAEVAKQTVRALEKGQHELVTPWFVKTALLIRPWNWLYHRLSNLFVGDVMKNY